MLFQLNNYCQYLIASNGKALNSRSHCHSSLWRYCFMWLCFHYPYRFVHCGLAQKYSHLGKADAHTGVSAKWAWAHNRKFMPGLFWLGVDWWYLVWHRADRWKYNTTAYFWIHLKWAESLAAHGIWCFGAGIQKAKSGSVVSVSVSCRLLSVNKKPRISCGCPASKWHFHLKQQGLLISFAHGPSSLLLLKMARNPPKGVWKKTTISWICQYKVFNKDRKGHRKPEVSLLLLALAVLLAQMSYKIPNHTPLSPS